MGLAPNKENQMAEKKKTTKKTAKIPTEAKPAKAARVKVPKEDLMTFALRMPKASSVALHKSAGPRNASKVVAALADAFVKGDRVAFEAIVDTAREQRK